MELAECSVPLKNLGDGNFIFGTKKIFAKILNRQLAIKVGGGYMVVEDFIKTYGEAEEVRIKQMERSD